MSSDLLSRTEIVSNLQSFATSWRQRIDTWHADGRTGTESSHAQQFWSDLLKCFGIIPERIDLFERDAKRTSTGRHGRIDLLMSSMVIGEAKSLCPVSKQDRVLDEADIQLRDYLGNLSQTEFPKFAITSCFEKLRITRLDGSREPVTFTIDDIPQRYDELKFIIGIEPVSKGEEQEASLSAAKLMADLYTSILGDAVDEDPLSEETPNVDAGSLADQRSFSTSVLMTRLLFLMYGDDAGLWEADLFYRWVDETTTADSLGPQLSALFKALNTPEDKRPRNTPELVARFPYVNGGIFSDAILVDYFTLATREALLAACRFRWTRISVTVFGALFQLVKSKEARRAGGEHYTSEKNILKTIGPMFLDEYEAEAERLIKKKSESGQVLELKQFLDEMASNIYVDPACGGGNFLNLAYARLREIETRILVELARRDGKIINGSIIPSMDISLDQRMSIDSFYGFEIAWWPAKIAETSMFLVDHQANLKLAAAIGQAPYRLPIEITAHITHANALAFDWGTALKKPKGKTFIFGNPPFIGQSEKTDSQTADMKRVWGNQYNGYLDYVTGWHAKALDLLRDRNGEFAYVTTNSITQGLPVAALFEPILHDKWRIKFAHRPFAWDSEAPGKAAVHCCIIGFTKSPTGARFRSVSKTEQKSRGVRKTGIHATSRLWDYTSPTSNPVEIHVKIGINPYLLDAENHLVKARSKPISPEVPPLDYGSKPACGKNLTVSHNDYSIVSADKVAAKYLRPYVGAAELIGGKPRWCLWLHDIDPRDISASPVLKERLNAVRTFRANSKKTSTQDLASTPSLFAENRQPQEDYLCIPRHFSMTRRYMTVDLLPANTIASDAVFTASDPTGLAFALITSAMFMAWQDAIGGRIKSDNRFANTLTWNTFPVPPLTDKQRAAIVKAGKGVLKARALHPNRSLDDHYAPLGMSAELIKAHKILDTAVDEVFGATVATRLDSAFQRYLELASEA